MQNQARTRSTSQTTPATTTTHAVVQAVDRLADQIKGSDNAYLLGLAAVARLSFRLGITCALSPSSDPTEIVDDLGFWWSAEVRNALDVQPSRTVETLRAAMAVIEQVVNDVKRRRLAG